MTLYNHWLRQFLYQHRTSFVVIFVWTVVTLVFLGWNIYTGPYQVVELAVESAQANFNNTLAYRYWAATHGGFYAPIEGELSNGQMFTPESAIVTESGKRLTLMKDTDLFRQFYNQAVDGDGVKWRLTSLKLMNPANAPDLWERQALKALQQGATEALQITETNRQPYLHLMRPLYVEKICLACHGQQGYKLGDLRGGVSISIPMKPYLEYRDKSLSIILISHSLFWLLGVAVVVLLAYRKHKHVLEFTQAETALKESQEKTRLIASSAQDGIVMLNVNGLISSINPAGLEMLGYAHGEAIGKQFYTLIAEENYRQLFQKSFSVFSITGYVATFGKVLELNIVRKDGTKFLAELSVSSVKMGSGWNALGFIRDISERKASEELLNKERQRLFNLLEGLPAFIYLLAPDYSVRFANRYFRERFGDPNGRPCYKILKSKETPCAICSTLKALDIKTQCESEWRSAVDNRVYRIYEYPFEDSDGANLIMKLGIDITESKRYQEELRKLSQAVEQSPISVAIMDTNGLIEYTNPRFVETSGYGYDELIGAAWSQIKSECQPGGRREKVWQKIIDHGPWRGEFHNKKKDGTDYWELTSVSPIKNATGQITHFLDVSEDITELKSAAETIQRDYYSQEAISLALKVALEPISLEEQLTRILDMILAVPWLFLQSKGCIYLIENKPDLFILKASRGFSEESVERFKEVKLDKSHCDQAGKHQQITFTSWSPELELQMSFVFEAHGQYCVPILSGEELLGVLNLYTAPDHQRDESDEEFLSTIADTIAGIVNRNRLETQLLQAQKMEAIGKLAGGVAHDFNNLLTAILGYSEFALEVITPEHAQLISDIEQIRNAGQKAASLTRQLLAFSRRQMLVKNALDLNAIVADIEKLLRRLIGEDIALVTDLSPDLERIMADPIQIEQVILNLAVNARDAMPQGGSITIKTKNTIPEGRDEEYVCLTVKDTGVGIPEEIMDKIFEPFFTTKGLGEGTGLGLSTVYGIVQQHEGWVNVDSQPGKGATFKVYLPVYVETLEETTAPIIPDSTPQSKGKRILLVEDDGVVRQFAARTLRQNHYIVFEAANFEEAIEMFQKENQAFDLVFSDVVLPDKTGLHLVEQLLKENDQLRILLTSGYAEQKSQWAAIQQRGFPFIPKPYSVAELLKAVKSALLENE